MNESHALTQLRSLEPGMHHVASPVGLWLMIGRSLPDTLTWSSVPPADSLSIVWGQGGCDIRHSGSPLTIERGDVLWIDAHHPHRGQGYAGSDFLTIFLLDGGAALGTGTGTRTKALVAPLPDSLHRAALQVAALLLEGEQLEADHPALQPIIGYRQAMRDAPDPSRLRPGNLRRAKRLLESRFDQDIGLDELAAEANLSAPHFSRTFTEVCGLPPIQYRKQLRLLAATHHIALGGSITEAALEAGFSDSAHLSRTFRAQYGISPSEWQEELSSDTRATTETRQPTARGTTLAECRSRR